MLETPYRILFYRSVTDRCQACDYARAMSRPHRAKAKRWFIALSKQGPSLSEDYGKHLRDGIWELRIAIQHHQHRFLYSFWKSTIIVTNAFLKKSAAVPPEEIERARRAMADWVARFGAEEP